MVRRNPGFGCDPDIDAFTAVLRPAALAAPVAEAAMPAIVVSLDESRLATVGAIPSAEAVGLRRYANGPDGLCKLDALRPLPARFALARRIAAVRLPRHDRRLHDTALDPGSHPPIPLSD